MFVSRDLASAFAVQEILEMQGIFSDFCACAKSILTLPQHLNTSTNTAITTFTSHADT